MIRIFLILSAVFAFFSAPVLGETPKPFPKFEAKRIKPPKRGEKPKLIQITPQAASPVASASEDGSAQRAKGPTGRYDWFWTKVSADLADAGPGRLGKALEILAGASAKVATPRLQNLQEITKSNGVDILRSTIGTQVSPALVLAVIAIESSGRKEAVSSVGAQGLMQLMPATAARFGVNDVADAAQNISGGVKYLDWLMTEFDGDPILVLAGYNAGEGAVRQHKGVPPFAETRDYVPKVLAAFQVAKGLCQTPPDHHKPWGSECCRRRASDR